MATDSEGAMEVTDRDPEGFIVQNRLRASLRGAVVVAVIAMLCGVVPLGHGPRASAAPIAIDVQVGDGPGQGFNDPVLGPQRLSAMRSAARIWGRFFVASFPGETVHVLVQMVPTLDGFGAKTTVSATSVSTGVGDVTVQRPIAEHVAGRELFDGVDAVIQFSEDVPFFLEPTGNPGDRLDFVTLALHEMGHVFGFISNMQADGVFNGAAFGPIPNLYDLFVRDATGVPLIFLSPAQRAAAATSGTGLLWGGAAATAANGGTRPNLSAGNPFLEATSVIHLSESFFPGDVLLDAGLLPGEVIRRLGPVERGMFEDMQWTLAPVPELSALMLLAVGVVGILGGRRYR
jgi:hypothetical protein